MKRATIKNQSRIDLLIWRIGANSHAAMMYYHTAFYKLVVDGDHKGAMDLIRHGDKRENIVVHDLTKLHGLLRRA